MEQGGGHDIALFTETNPSAPFAYIPVTNGLTLMNDLVLALRGEQFDRAQAPTDPVVVQSTVVEAS